MLRQLDIPAAPPELLVGLPHGDDAGVYRLLPDLALVQTVDFFTPVVDDPYAFGMVAAANALSDVYAMGGRPLLAMNILGFPTGRLPLSVMTQILAGGLAKLTEAGVILVGGHSVDDTEPKYGLAVTGVVNPDRLLTTAGARPGDRLVLTKPVGGGVVSTAIKRGLASPADIAEVTRVMAKLNDVVEPLQAGGVRAATDVTGFGLLGHARNLAAQSGVGLELWAGAVPLLAAARRFAGEGVVPAGSRKNRLFAEQWVTYDPAVTEELRVLLNDAMTSGGLLVAVPADGTELLIGRLKEAGALSAVVVGRVTEGPAGTILVLP